MNIEEVNAKKDIKEEILLIAKGVSLTIALSDSRENCVVKIVII